MKELLQNAYLYGLVPIVLLWLGAGFVAGVREAVQHPTNKYSGAIKRPSLDNMTPARHARYLKTGR